MADYVVLYNSTTGAVDAMWPRTTSDNISTAATDGYISVDGVKVAEPYDSSGGYSAALVLLTDPTFTDTNAPSGVAEVDSTTAPTDATAMASGGTKDPFYTS